VAAQREEYVLQDHNEKVPEYRYLHTKGYKSGSTSCIRCYLKIIGATTSIGTIGTADRFLGRAVRQYMDGSAGIKPTVFV
jgi:hypothetical protein